MQPRDRFLGIGRGRCLRIFSESVGSPSSSLLNRSEHRLLPEESARGSEGLRQTTSIFSSPAAAAERSTFASSFTDRNGSENATPNRHSLSCCLSSSEDSFEPLIVDFIWANDKRQRTLKRSIGSNFTVTWNSEKCELLIRPKREENVSREEGWRDKCKENFLQHLDEYECKKLPVEPQFWDRIIKAAREEEKNYAGDIAIHTEQRSKLIIIGKEKTASDVLALLQPELRKIKEGETRTSQVQDAVGESESVKSVTAVIEKELVSRSVTAAEDGGREVQEFIRGAIFASFVEKTLKGRNVVLCPSLDEVKSTPLSNSISFSVVGYETNVKLVSSQINCYLDDNVLYTLEASLPSRAHFQFVKNFREKEVREIEKRHEAEIAFTSDCVKLRANKKELPLVHKAVKQLVDNIRTESKKMEKHGLERYVQSEDFSKEKNHVESKYSVCIVKDLRHIWDLAPRIPAGWGRGRGGRLNAADDTQRKPPKIGIRLSESLPSLPNLTPSFSSVSSLTVTIKEGNIADKQVDVIVNSANASLDLKSALESKALLRVAGPGLQEACSAYVKSNGKLNEGEIATTDGYGLSCSYVFHVVCSKSSKGLSDLVSSSLEKASSLGATSIAFPALGTGTLGLSDATSAQAIFSAIQKFQSSQTTSSSLKDICVIIYDHSRMATFRKERSRVDNERSFSIVEPAEASVLTAFNQAHLSNGCVVSVVQGDVVTTTTDVIVIPTDNSLNLAKGVVSSKVLAAAGGNLSQEVSTNYSRGIKWGKMADLTPGQLQCQRIYALACLAKSQSDKKSLKDSVFQCILTADQSGFASVAIPALGTGNLGYSNRESARAIYEAALEFSSQSAFPSLQNIQVIVFDAERLDYFISELNSSLVPLTSTRATTGFTGMPNWNCVFGRVGNSVSSVGCKVVEIGNARAVFTTEATKAKEMKAIEPLAPDVIQIFVIGDQSAAALNDLVTAVNKACIVEEVDVEFPESLDPEFVQKMKGVSKREHVILSVKVLEGQPRIFLEGWERDCNKVQKMVHKELTTEWRKEKALAERKSKLGHIGWSYYCEGKGFLPFTSEASVSTEEALEKKGTVSAWHGTERFVADPVKRKLTCTSSKHRSKEVFVLRREEVVDGIFLPPTWNEPTSNSSQQIPLDKLSWEYSDVAKKFEASSKVRRKKIVSIRRIQNLRLYRLYAKEKKEVEEKITRHGSSQPVERQLWHGTKGKALEHIMEKGFNRSLAGTNAGRRFGQGVYFAVNASYSVRYAADEAAGRNMFLCKVLIGLYAKGYEELKEPPLINESVSRVDRYDSVVDNVANPTVFSACHRDNQAYPEYLIVFE